MRPDQHKKKKNAEYKKKHGIQNQGKNKNINKSDQHDSGDTKQLAKGNERTDLDDDPYSEKDVESDNQRKHFSKRQMESNWDRYKEEDLHTDKDFDPVPLVTKIGADFQILLDKTDGPSSHFHFQSEKEWGIISENDSKVGPTPLSIDFKSLAQALRDIPLEKRFEIDKKYFEDEQLNTETSLEEHKSTTLSTHLYSIATQVDTEKSKQTFSPNFARPDKLSQKPKANKHDSTMANQVLLSHTQKVKRDVNDIQNTSSSSLVDEDDFLDHLLGIETTETKTDIKVNTQQEKRHNVLIIKDNSKTDVVPKVSKPPQETKEDLEDWLDSILD